MTAEKISDQNATFSTLKEKLDYFQSLFENAAIGIYRTTPDGRILMANPALIRMLGYDSFEDLARLNLEKDHPYPEGCGREAFLVALKREGVLLKFENRWLKKDGTVIEVRESANVVRDGEGNIIYYDGTVEDITEEKALTTAIRESEERYSLAVRGANDGIWDWDIKTKTIYYSPRWKEILGYGDEEIEDDAEEWFNRVHVQDIKALHAVMTSFLLGDEDNFFHEHRILHRDGTYRWVLIRGLATRNDEGHAIRVTGSMTDITTRKRMESQITRNTLYDTLTSLPNRTLFVERVKVAMEHTQRFEGHFVAVIIVNMENLGSIVQTYGYAEGDLFIKHTARRINSCLKEGETLARFGSCKFAVLKDEITSVEEAAQTAGKILATVQSPVVIQGDEITPRFYAGMATNRVKATTPEDLLRNTEMALNYAKEAKSSKALLFDEEILNRTLSSLDMETAINQALDKGELCHYYQPIVALPEQRVVGFEALIRWNHTERGLLSPAEFVPIAEETGIIKAIDRWGFASTCRQLKKWRRQKLTRDPITVSVNFSGKHFSDADLPNWIDFNLRKSGISYDFIKIEITESTLVQNIEFVGEMLNFLKDLNLKFSIDDFGTGYSSLAYLQRLEIDTIKVDQSFVREIETDERSYAIVKTIIDLAHNLGKDVIAEGIETGEQARILNRLKCDMGQGYFYSRPLPLEQATKKIGKIIGG